MSSSSLGWMEGQMLRRCGPAEAGPEGISSSSPSLDRSSRHLVERALGGGEADALELAPRLLLKALEGEE